MTTFESIRSKVYAGQRISDDDALFLFKSPDLVAIGKLADDVCKRKNGDTVFYNVNRHINPTNICVYDCKFCAYAKKPGEEGAYAYDTEEMVKKAKEAVAEGATEIHMVGGLHPRWKFSHYLDILKAIKAELPEIHIKGFTAVEIEWLSRKARLTIKDTLVALQAAGLDSMPGGGAEIFHQDIRDKITAKMTAEEWIDVHRTAHNLGMHSNCTMLYGHVEQYEHRVDHMSYLRRLQDETGGFNAFIPLSFQPHQNQMGIKRYTFGVDDLKTIAIARLYLDNFDHIKAYWIMLGQDIAQLAINFGANDLDGTVLEEKISRAAGGRSGMHLSKSNLESIIHKARKTAQERDTVYNPVGEPVVPKILSLTPPDEYDKIFSAFKEGKDLEADDLKIISKYAPIHELIELSGKISRQKTGNSATFGLCERFKVKTFKSLDHAIAVVEKTIEETSLGTTLVLDLAGVSKLDDFISFRDFIELVRMIRSDYGNYPLIVASPKGLWKLAREEKIDYAHACGELREAGVMRIASSYAETETNLTHSEVKMLYTAAGKTGLKTTGKIELACPPKGLPLWESFIDRLIAIRSVACESSLDVINVEPAKATTLTPIEYLRAVAMTRIVLNNVARVSTPLHRIPTISGQKGIGTEYTQHPQEKLAGICLLAGSNDLGLLEEKSITVASIAEDIRSAGLIPRLRDGSYYPSSPAGSGVEINTSHIPNLVPTTVLDSETGSDVTYNGLVQ